MIDAKRRELFSDLYRLAEYYEAPVFKAGDIEGNSAFFVRAQKEAFAPFMRKYEGNKFASDLAIAVLDECSRRAAEKNKEVIP